MLTIAEIIDFLVPGGSSKLSQPPPWPPDAFAIVALILLKSGAYLTCLKTTRSKNWDQEIQQLGGKWRLSCIQNTAPSKIRAFWRILVKNKNLALDNLNTPQNREICNALLNIAAAADEASVGIGIDVELDDPFLSEATKLLVITNSGRTLCKEIDWSRVSVLPKLHTPQSGLTIRSVSHHLSLCETGEVSPYWFNFVDTQQQVRHSLNLLLIPWPNYVAPVHFRNIKTVFNGRNKYGYFSYKIRGGERLQTAEVLQLFKKAQNMVGRIDGVIFPELSLRHGEPKTLHRRISQISPETFLIGGVGTNPSKRSGLSDNSWIFLRRFLRGWVVEESQSKHHRWRLNKRQIIQYGLGSQLDPELTWWEHTSLRRRELKFFVLHPWLTLCILICEDLARQDPISDLVRSVGPNLVIALLFDGPQLESRWSARYATVLADDPGSSVLTLTSLGMSQLSRPPGSQVRRTVALWKDARSGQSTEIELPSEDDAVVITLTKEEREEYTVDGRSDGGVTGYLILSGTHYLRLD